MGGRIAQGIVCAVTAALLAVTLVAAGFAACAAPATTRLLADATASTAPSPYGEPALTELACATRAYTVDARSEESLADLSYAVIEQAGKAAAADSPTAERWSAQAREVAQRAALRSVSPVLIAADLAACGDAYALDAGMLAHLDDCNRLIGAAAPWLAGCALGAAAGIAGLAAMGRRRLVGMALASAPAAVLGAFALLGLWGALDFGGLFGAFHALLFPQGNWTFSMDSLLISMYPIGFWMGMAGVWLGTSALLAIISLIVGIFLIRKKKES